MHLPEAVFGSQAALAQKISGSMTRGQSVTDACIGWDDTVGVLEAFAEAVRKRRA